MEENTERLTVPFSDFAKVDLRVGLVQEAVKVEGSQKLIKLVVDFSDDVRTIFTGLQAWYEPDYFAGKKFVFVYNLEPKAMPGGKVSQGMLLAVDGKEKPLPVEAPEGSGTGEKLT